MIQDLVKLMEIVHIGRTSSPLLLKCIQLIELLIGFMNQNLK